MFRGTRRRERASTFAEVQRAISGANRVQSSAVRPPTAESIQILPEFVEVKRLVEEGFPLVFVTGGAGTGKSTFIRWLDNEFSGRSILCAPTGIAALTIGGKTIHSLCKFPPAWIVKGDIRRDEKSRAILQKAKVIIVDEISMVNANLLDSLNLFLQLNLGNSEPFGGISIVMVGDLFQLPPVVTASTRRLFDEKYSSPKFFAAHCLSDSPFEAFELTKTFRQTDQRFVDLLGKVRRGTELERTVASLNSSCLRSGDPPEGAVWLCPRNIDVSEINTARLEALKGETREYEAISTGKFRDSQLPVATSIRLKVGAQVVMANNTKAWVNGSVATVRELGQHSIKISLTNSTNILEVSRHQWDQYDYVVDEQSGDLVRRVVGSFQQLPVNLSWAMTIHKSQGLTIPKVHLDLGRGAFETGQTYVALSRCRQIEDVSLAREIQLGDIKVDPDATAFYRAAID